MNDAVTGETINNETNSIHLKSIGIIRTEFPEKRAVPRQTTLCPKLLGCIEIVKDVFNNPEHSLDGLNEFSHLWIIYHFHKNESHPKAKVAPPRLSGARVGIFSTRSPHRPCPIGLSLVQIDRIEGNSIYFYGTDMVDGTPVLDIKPYIPYYDSPSNTTNIGMFCVRMPGIYAFYFIFYCFLQSFCLLHQTSTHAMIAKNPKVKKHVTVQSVIHLHHQFLHGQH